LIHFDTDIYPKFFGAAEPGGYPGFQYQEGGNPMLPPILLLLNVVIYPFAAWGAFVTIKGFYYRRKMKKYCLKLWQKLKNDEDDFLRLGDFFRGPEKDRHLFLDYARKAKDYARLYFWVLATHNWDLAQEAQMNLDVRETYDSRVTKIKPPGPESLPHLNYAAKAIARAEKALRDLAVYGLPKEVKKEYWSPPEPDPDEDQESQPEPEREPSREMGALVTTS
jgi:hypothetical protein